MKTIRRENKRMKRKSLVNDFLCQQGMSVIEVILAAAIFLYLVAVAGSVVIHSFSANRLGEEKTQAALLASEGLEAVRSIKNQDFANLISGNYDVVVNGSLWQLGPTPTPGGEFQRIINISDVYRDGEGEIVESGGTLDEEIKRIISTVSWQFSPARSNNVEMMTYLADWVSGICFWNDYEIIGSGDTVYGSRSISAEARDVFVVDGYAYLVSDYALFDRPEFFIFDTTDPSGELTIVGSLNLDTTVNAVYVAGDFAYLATNRENEELVVINVSNPASPVKVGDYDADPGGWLLSDGMDVWVEDNKVYLSTRINISSGIDPEFYVLEVNTSDPYNVTFSTLGYFDIDHSINGIFIEGNYAYLATADQNREFQIVDISNPASPQVVCWYDLEKDSIFAWANSVFINDGRAYVVTQKSGNNDQYYVLELHPPYNGCSGDPESFISKIASSKINADVNDVFVYEGFVFLADEKGNEEFMVASVDDPTNFVFTANLGGKAYAVYVYQCLAYVATGDNDGELQVIQPQ